MGGLEEFLRGIARLVPSPVAEKTPRVEELKQENRNLKDIIRMHALDAGHTRTRNINLINRIRSDLARGKNVDDLVEAAEELGLLKQVGRNKGVGEPVDYIEQQREEEEKYNTKGPIRTYRRLTVEQVHVYKQVMGDLKRAGYLVPDLVGREILSTEKKPTTIVVKEVEAPTGDVYAGHEAARQLLVRFAIKTAQFLHEHDRTQLVWTFSEKVDESAAYAHVELTRAGLKVKQQVAERHASRAVTPYVDRSFSNMFIIARYASPDEAVRAWEQEEHMKRDLMPHDFETLIFRTTHGHNIGDILYKIPAPLSLQEELSIVDAYANCFGLAVDKALWQDVLDRGIRLSCSRYGEPNENPFLRDRVARHIKHVAGAKVEPAPQAIIGVYNSGLRGSMIS